MEKSTIIRAIEARVMSRENKKYSIWTIGITDEPERRKSEHENGKDTQYWMDWEADSEKDVREIEKHFLGKGMKGDTGGGLNPTYVYTF